jgi:transposase InsO family protein
MMSLVKAASLDRHVGILRCVELGIEHRFTRIDHPWTNGQVERMNRTIKDATVKRFHYDSHEQLRRQLRTSSPPTTSPAASSGCAASHPTNLSAKHGQPSSNASRQIRTIKCRD